MGPESEEHVTHAPPSGLEELVSRVLASPAMSRSQRLRELLAYVCEWSLTRNGSHLTEEQIGIAVFGRAPGYDTSSDTIVRVQVSQLRKKLEQHFATDGAHEPLIIEVPHRTYAPVFRPRFPSPDPPLAPQTTEVSIRQNEEPEVKLLEVVTPPRSRAALLLAAACGILAVVAVWLGVDNYRIRHEADRQHPASNLLLRQFFGGRRALIVVSDGVVLAANDFLKHLITPQEYRSGFPGRRLEQTELGLEGRTVLERVAGMNLTTLQDVQVASQLAQRLEALGVSTSIVFTRDFRYQPQIPENLILIGHRKANPWTAVFEEKLNFQYAWEPVHRKASILNRAPAPGEAPELAVKFGVESYAVVAMLPKPGGEGTVLLLEGGDMGSAIAAASLVCADERVTDLHRRLGVADGSRLPWFEVVMRTRLTGNVVHSAEIVAHRLHQAGATDARSQTQ